MRVLFLTTSHNSMSQRLQVELTRRGYTLSIEFALSDKVMEEAAALFQPDLILAPFLKAAVPESVWSHYPTLIVHPGVRGDRGAYSLDHAIMQGQPRWGVTLLQANAEMDAGDVWAWREFPMRQAPKSSIYQNEVVEAAVECVLEALHHFPAWRRGEWRPTPLKELEGAWGVLHPVIKQKDRAIDWATMPTQEVIRRIQAADGSPGVLDEVLGLACYFYGARPSYENVNRGTPGEVVAHQNGAILRRTLDGAVWISHLKTKGGIKLPATQVLGDRLAGIPEWWGAGGYQEIRYWEETVNCPPYHQLVGHLAWEFQGGAFSTEQARSLREAIRAAKQRPIAALVLWGGHDTFCNGIHLGTIEAAKDPALESWESINAINDVVLELLEMEQQMVFSAVRGNAGAGGVILALAADRVLLRRGVVLNPHYKGMGGLYGSEYWTYLLPRRVGQRTALELTNGLLPLGDEEALRIGLVDALLPGDRGAFAEKVEEQVWQALHPSILSATLALKQQARNADRKQKSLERYRVEELAQMGRNFWGETAYHQARREFVYKIAPTSTPAHLALHRRAREVNV